MASSTTTTLVITVMFVSLPLESTVAQPCLALLVPCQNYLKTTTTPPSSCCDSLAQAVMKQLPCLCNMLQNKPLLQQFGIEPAQALDLPKRCGLSENADVCSNSTSIAIATATTTTAATTSSSSYKKANVESCETSRTSMAAITVVIVVVLSLFWGSTTAQDTSQCFSAVMPCIDFLTSSKPPSSSCCDSVEGAVNTQLPCVCNLLKNRDLFDKLNVNLVQLLTLANNCRITSRIILCGNSTNAPSTPAGTSTSSPSTSGNPATGTNNKDSASEIARIGISGAMSLILFWWSMIG